MAKTSFKQADLARALRASLSAGLRPAQAKITMTGELLLSYHASNEDYEPDNAVDAEIERHFRVRA